LGIHAFQACALNHSATSPVCFEPFDELMKKAGFEAGVSSNAKGGILFTFLSRGQAHLLGVRVRAGWGGGWFSCEGGTRDGSWFFYGAFGISGGGPPQSMTCGAGARMR
jgi:hypothetical protein